MSWPEPIQSIALWHCWKRASRFLHSQSGKELSSKGLCLFGASDVNRLQVRRLQLAACRGMSLNGWQRSRHAAHWGCRENKAIRQDAQHRRRIPDMVACATVQLLKKFGEHVHVDIIDRLPTPFGLVRSGVAPDHQDTKVAFTDVRAKPVCELIIMHRLLLEQT